MPAPRVLAAVAAAVVLQLPSAPAAQGPFSTVVKRYTPADQRTGRYQYVPFDVPAGRGTLRISYAYDRADGANVIDLGLFEPGSLELGTPAFRGYSGGARSAIEISPRETTPGYRPGAIPAGRWHVMLGLYKVAPAGVEVTINIETQDGPAGRDPAPFVRRRVAPAASSAARWYAGALHTHTVHSDGTITPAELLLQARKARLDFVVITDHNNVTHQYEIETQFEPALMPLWIIGEEVTTPGGHATVMGLGRGDWIDFRVTPGDGRIDDLVAAARKSGALFSINHPVSACDGCGWTHEIVDGIDAIEISNGSHGEMPAALKVWDDLLRKGRRITAVGSSDWHRAPASLSDAHVRVHASELTKEAIVAAIRDGRVIVMRNLRDATPEIALQMGERTIRVGEVRELAVGGGGRATFKAVAPGAARVVAVVNGERRAPLDVDLTGVASGELLLSPGYVRFELFGPLDPAVPVAVTNPVYLTP